MAVSTAHTNTAESHLFPLLYHGSCKRCHHLHTAIPIYPIASETHRVRYSCGNCNVTVLQFGGRSTQTSLASQETVSTRSGRRRGSSRRDSQCVDDGVPLQSSALPSPLPWAGLVLPGQYSTAPLPEAIEKKRARPSGTLKSELVRFRKRVFGRLRRARANPTTLREHEPCPHCGRIGRLPTQHASTMTEVRLVHPPTPSVPPQTVPQPSLRPVSDTRAGSSDRPSQFAQHEEPGSAKARRIREQRRLGTLRERRRCLCSDNCRCMRDSSSVESEPSSSSKLLSSTNSKDNDAPKKPQSNVLGGMGMQRPPPQTMSSEPSLPANLEESSSTAGHAPPTTRAALRIPSSAERGQFDWPMRSILRQLPAADTPNPHGSEAVADPEATSSSGLNGHLTESGQSSQSRETEPGEDEGGTTPTGAPEVGPVLEPASN